MAAAATQQDRHGGKDMQTQQIEQLTGLVKQLGKAEGLALGGHQATIDQGKIAHQVHHHLQQQH